MFAVITLDHIFSGLIGALIGAATAFFLNWWNSFRSAKDALRVELIRVKLFKVYELGKGRRDFLEKFRESYPAVLSAMLAYRSRLPPCCRGKIDEAWLRYRAGDKTDHLSLIARSHVDVSSDEEFQERIDRMLDVID